MSVRKSASLIFRTVKQYKHPGLFHDITSGRQYQILCPFPLMIVFHGIPTGTVSIDNPGCGTRGFSAVPGWDPGTYWNTISGSY